MLRGRKPVRPKTAGQKRYVDAVRAHTVTFGIGPAGTGKSYLAVALAVQALQAKEINRIILTRPAVEAGERLGFLPGDILAKVDPYLRPLYDALYDMLEPEVVQPAHGARHHRGRAARVHARPHAQRLVHHPRRGAEHHPRADEDVPHPPRVRLEDRRHRRRHPDRPARGRGRSGLLAVRDILDGIPDLAFVELDAHDVVRHKIVQDIVNAYERASGVEARDDRAGTRLAR